MTRHTKHATFLVATAALCLPSIEAAAQLLFDNSYGAYNGYSTREYENQMAFIRIMMMPGLLALALALPSAGSFLPKPKSSGRSLLYP